VLEDGMASNPMARLRLISALFFSGGAVTGAMALGSLSDECVQGTVVQSRYFHGRHEGWSVTVEYPVGEHATHEWTFVAHSTEYRVGQQVPVRYDPDQPGHARLDSFFSIWVTPALALLIGAVVGAISFGVRPFWKHVEKSPVDMPPGTSGRHR
jgi:hypothetical protein